MEVLEQTLDSREVAKMVGMRHDNLLQKINSYIKYLRKDAALKNKVGEYFIQSEYFDDNSQLRRCFQVSKKGCDMIANKLSGEKGVLFTARYIEIFTSMETHIKQQDQLPQSPRAQLKLMFDFQEETAERVDAIEDDLNDIRENQLLCEPDYSTISKMVRRKVNTISEEQHLNNKHKKELFMDLNGSIKKITGVVARNRIKAKDFDKVVEFINNWQPSTATMTIIKQMKLDDE
ncbi:hypothetical protein A5881_002938 [Enterococcus termitis]|nr:hypothetical protein A5881_002407 [Enterococcus termitis]